MLKELKKYNVGLDILKAAKDLTKSQAGKFYSYETGEEERILYHVGNIYIDFFYDDGELVFISFMENKGGEIDLIDFGDYTVQLGVALTFSENKDEQLMDNVDKIIERVAIENGLLVYYQYNQNNKKLATFTYRIDENDQVLWDEKPLTISVFDNGKWTTINRTSLEGSTYRLDLLEFKALPSLAKTFVSYSYKNVMEKIKKSGFKTSVPFYIREYIAEDYIKVMEYQNLADMIKFLPLCDAMIKKGLAKGDKK